MADIDNFNFSGQAQEKLKWVTPQIAVMLTQETSAKVSNPREGGNSTEGFMGPS